MTNSPTGEPLVTWADVFKHISKDWGGGTLVIPLPEDLRTREGSKRAYDRNYDRIFGPKQEEAP